MEYIILQTFSNYIDAHIIKGRLESEGITCWLKDEHLSSVIANPVFTNTIANIKLMVPASEYDSAREILNIPPSDQ